MNLWLLLLSNALVVVCQTDPFVLSGDGNTETEATPLPEELDEDHVEDFDFSDPTDGPQTTAYRQTTKYPPTKTYDAHTETATRGPNGGDDDDDDDDDDMEHETTTKYPPTKTYVTETETPTPAYTSPEDDDEEETPPTTGPYIETPSTTPEISIKPKYCWTPWFDRDDPSGKGDYETIYHLRKENPGKICDKPHGMQVQTISGLPASSTGNSFYKNDLTTGFICRNRDQKNGRCLDYKVRFWCPCVPECWTQWFDVDDPTGTGDWETLTFLRLHYPGKICKRPLEIEAQTTAGVPAAATGQNFYRIDTDVGLICRNHEQKIHRQCFDYRVRFRCPYEFCYPQPCWTRWFDRDDPSGSGDWETLFALRAEFPGQICNSPLEIQVLTTSGNSVASTGNVITASNTAVGFICENKNQKKWKKCADFKVRFRCPDAFCSDDICWTSWYDRDDPSGTGDWELLTDLRKENPNQICDTPLYIDVRTVDSNQPITQTGQQHHIYSPTEGFACRNDAQKGCRCQDYKVRFGCPCNCTVHLEDPLQIYGP
uniref:WxxW domain-containing protein n=1 Tax=Knipowitschia caucasica TaxID=637954 RepID=A0AAV2J240_KNICA